MASTIFPDRIRSSRHLWGEPTGNQRDSSGVREYGRRDEWVFNHTQGSVLIAGILLHATANAFASEGLPSFFPPTLLLKNAPLPFLTGFAVTVLLLIVVTRGRLDVSARKLSLDPVPTQDEERV